MLTVHLRVYNPLQAENLGGVRTNNLFINGFPILPGTKMLKQMKNNGISGAIL